MRIINRSLARVVVLYIVLGTVSLAAFGCAKKEAKVVHGNVACGGEKVAIGQLLFVPLGATPGSNVASPIRDGQYRADARGGLMLGKYQVRITGYKTTGRKVPQYNGLEESLVEEEVSVVPTVYNGEQSPLTVEVGADWDGRFDVDLPGYGSKGD